MLPPRYCSCVSAVTQKHGYWISLVGPYGNAFMSCVGKAHTGEAGLFPCRSHKMDGRGGSLTAQLAKSPPAMQETLVQFLGQEDLLLGLPLWLTW